MKQDEKQKPQTIHTEMHPSGLTMERWRFPFKTPEEREKIRQWMALNNINDNSIPF